MSESAGFRLEKSDAGVTLVATGAWTKEADEVLDSGRADGVDLNYAKGFKDTSLDFLQAWPLKRFTLLARTVKNLAPIYSLAASLKSLSVQSAPSALIDLGRLPNLTELSADWRQIRDSIGDAHDIRDLFVHHYAEPDLAALASLVLLQRLRMKDRPSLQSLDGLDALVALTHLGIYLASNLHDIDAMRSAYRGLDALHLESCRAIRDLAPLANCTALRLLNVSDSGDIESLAPLTPLSNLEVVWLYGTTRIVDGDLTPLARLARLRELRMQSRRGYHPTVTDINAAITARTQ
jgi:hypothetical protein